MCENRRGKEVAIASPVRQVVALMVLAAVLFFAAGVLNGAYPGGPGWIDRGGFAWLTYVFGVLNVLVALWIWRGSERGLLTRIVLAMVFLFVVGLLALSQPTVASGVIYVITGLIEVVIFLDAIRVWRLGRGANAPGLDAVFSLDAPLAVAIPEPSAVVAPRPTAAPVVHAPALLSARLTWAIGLLSLALAAVLFADGVVAGFVPGGGEWGFYGKQSGWLVYIFAFVVLVVAMRAVHGSALSLRLLLTTGLILFVERLFSFLAIGGATPGGLALRVVTAILALTMATTSVVGLRSAERARRSTTRITFQHATGGQ